MTTKVDIRTDESHQREQRAKVVAHDLLLRRGFSVLSTERRGNRHVLSAIDPTGKSRVLWFKLGWNPAAHGTSAVQLTMLKHRAGEVPPGQWPSEMVLAAVVDKVQRAASDGITDLLLFSLESDNENPLAALLMPIAQVERAFTEALTLDESLARKGASPSLWLRGATLQQKALAERLLQYCEVDLLSQDGWHAREIGDSIHDLVQTPSDPEHAGSGSPERVLRTLATYARDPQVRGRVIEAAKGACEYCGLTGFVTVGGKHYLEAHHILALSADGPDTPDNVIALCAEDHRRAHFGKDWADMAAKMLAIVASRRRH